MWSPRIQEPIDSFASIRTKGEQTVYTRKSLNITLTVFRESRTGMFSFPSSNWKHGGNTGTSLLDLKHQLCRAPAVRHQISRDKRLVGVNRGSDV